MEVERARTCADHDARRPSDGGERRAVAVAIEGIDRPFAGRREIQLVVARSTSYPDERLEAGVSPELAPGARRARWRDAQTLEIAGEDEAESERFAVARRPHRERVHRFGRRLR